MTNIFHLDTQTISRSFILSTLRTYLYGVIFIACYKEQWMCEVDIDVIE